MAKNKLDRKKHAPEVVTGDFELHFEEVVNRNRYTLVAVITGGLLLLTLFVPGAVYYSKADTGNSLIEAESGQLINSSYTVRSGSSGSDGYIEFKVPETKR